MRTPHLQYKTLYRQSIPPEDITPELAWLDRFPALKSSLRISKDQGAIELPYYIFDTLYKDHIVLPLDSYEQGTIPPWLNEGTPMYFYSALVLFGDAGLVTFDTDFTSYEHFVRSVQQSIEPQKNLRNMRWGIKVLASKLPHPIAASREVCFHLGHNDMDLPAVISLSLTNICNLRCTICGSQAHLDTHKIARKSMKREVFEKIAHTLFPFCNKVELNSLGEPTLHKDFAYFIELINCYGCELRLQTNGTNLKEDTLQALKTARGCLSLSIDATGKLFEQQRVNASWEKVEANVRQLLANRNRSLLEINLYPTLTRRTITDAVTLCKWANGIGIDRIFFHYYEPILNGMEESPTDAEKTALERDLLAYIVNEKPQLLIKLQSKDLKPHVTFGDRLTRRSNDIKWRLRKIRSKIAEHPAAACKHYAACVLKIIKVRLLKIWWKINPWGKMPILPRKFPSYRYYDHNSPKQDPLTEGAHPHYICAAPLRGAVIGLDGDISVCCRTDKTIFGSALSDEAFFECWFGEKMEAVRKSFLRENPVADCMPECKGCIAVFGLGD